LLITVIIQKYLVHQINLWYTHCKDHTFVFVISHEWLWLATGYGSIVCRCVWSRTIVIGYDIANYTITDNMSVCLAWLNWRKHFRVVGLSRSFYIELSHSFGEMKCGSRNTEEDFCRIKESFIIELNPSQAIMCRMVDLSDQRSPD